MPSSSDPICGRATRARRRRQRRAPMPGSTRRSASPAPSTSTSWHQASWHCRRLRPATYLGKGKVEEIAGLVKTHEAGLVVMDCALSPVQQRNLEKAWNAKVLDRTGLILEIFGRRARTREGALQVELAHLNYQRSRLVRSWTHLERQRGGFGFLGGPGETQIETDRRLIAERIAKHRARAGGREAHPQAASRQPQTRAVSDRCAGRLHQCRKIDPVQPPDPGDGAVGRHAVRHARSDPARDRSAARHADHPVRHGGLHLRPADHAGRGLPRHARRGDRGRPDPACARRLPWRHRGAVARRRARCCANSASSRTIPRIDRGLEQDRPRRWRGAGTARKPRGPPRRGPRPGPGLGDDGRGDRHADGRHRGAARGVRA